MKHPSQLRLAMAQINVTVGDIEGNVQKCLEWMDRAREADADIVTFPELALTGYPPEDLLLKPSFVRQNLEILRDLAKTLKGPAAVIGFVDHDKAGRLYNAAYVCEELREPT